MISISVDWGSTSSKWKYSPKVTWVEKMPAKDFLVDAVLEMIMGGVKFSSDPDSVNPR